MKTFARFLMLTLVGTVLWAGEATPQGDDYRVPDLAIDTRDLSAEERTQIDALAETINTTLQNNFPGNSDLSASDWDDIKDRRKADRLAEIERLFRLHEKVNGNYTVTKLGEIPLLGSVTVESRIVQQKRDYASNAFGAPADSHSLIQASGNLLENVNKKLKDASSKLSKHTCGNFDWVGQLKAKFRKEALEQYVDSLTSSALAAAPMALLATWSPTLYEIVKWLRMFAEADLDMQAANCQRMEAALTDIGQKMSRGTGYPECMRQHKDINYTDANKICNPGGSSAFDGMENWLGEIKSMGTSTDTFDIVAEAGRVSQSNTVARNEELFLRATERVDETAANLAANPDPGPAPAPDDPDFTTWKRMMDAHVRAKREHEEALKHQANMQLNTIVSGADEYSIWETLQHAIGENAGNLFGRIAVTSRFDLDIGRQPKVYYRLGIEHSGYKLQLELEDALVQHFDILASQYRGTGTFTQDDLFRSYKTLLVLCYETMKIHDPKTPGVYCDESTIDKMAFLISIHRAMPDDESKTVLENRYRINAHLRAVTCYEVAEYGRQEWLDERQKWMDQIREILVGSQNPRMEHILRVVEERANEIDGFWTELATEWKARVIDTLPAVNSYRYRGRHGKRFGDSPGIYAPEQDIPAVYLP